jgi:hypothetical protein
MRGRESELLVKSVRSDLLAFLHDPKHDDCPICHRLLTPEIRSRAIGEMEGQGSSTGDRQGLAQVRGQIEVLQQAIVAAKPRELRILWDNLEQTEREIYHKNADIDELKEAVERRSG